MKIQFKRISKELQSEGMTPDSLNKIQLLTVNLPVMFNAGEESVNVIKANDKEFWVVFPDMTYLKDDNGRMVTFPLKDVIIGRLRYYLLFKDDLIHKSTESEVVKIKAELAKIVIERAKNFNRVYSAAHGEAVFRCKLYRFRF